MELKIIPYGDPMCKLYDPGDSLVENSWWWYLDGKLEKLCGTDKGTIINLQEYPKILRETLYGDLAMYLEGEVQVKVMGIPNPCVGCFWVTSDSPGLWKQRGLVVLKSDIESLKKARVFMRTGEEVI